MTHVVLKPFRFSRDGINSEKMEVGREDDFGDVAFGLEAAGYIGPVKPAQAAPQAAEPPVPKDDAPAPAKAPTGRRSRR